MINIFLSVKHLCPLYLQVLKLHAMLGKPVPDIPEDPKIVVAKSIAAAKANQNTTAPDGKKTVVVPPKVNFVQCKDLSLSSLSLSLFYYGVGMELFLSGMWSTPRQINSITARRSISLCSNFISSKRKNPMKMHNIFTKYFTFREEKPEKISKYFIRYYSICCFRYFKIFCQLFPKLSKNCQYN